MQKRKFSRVEFKSEAFVQREGLQIKGEVDNLSLKGMFLNTAQKHPLNEAVDITIYLSGTSSELAINLKGIVVRHEDRGIAVNFNWMDLDSFIHLRNVIAYNMGDKDAVMEEFFNYMRANKELLS